MCCPQSGEEDTLMGHVRSVGLAVIVSMGLGSAALAAERQRPSVRRAVARATEVVQSAGVRARIARAKASMTYTVKQNATPVWQVFGQNATLTEVEGAIYDESNGHATDRPAKVRVGGLKAGDDLHLTALLPVSGHTGQAEQYKTTNVYALDVYHPDGQRDSHTFNSTDYVTPADFKLKLQSGETRIEFHPTATSVGGFMPGRRLLALQVP